MLNIYVQQKLPLGIVSEFPYRLNEDDTFATLKLRIAEKTGVKPEHQLLSIGVPPKYKLSEIDEFNDEWTLNMLLSDHICLTLEATTRDPKNSHQQFAKGDLSSLLDLEYRPSLEVETFQDHIYIARNLLSRQECASLIKYGEDTGFEKLFNTNPNYRTNTRMVVQDESFAEMLYERVRHIVPERREGIEGSNWRCFGLNETFRLCKYVPGQFFSKHEDSCFIRSDDEVSFYSVNLYLNEEFEKGATRFFETGEDEPYGKVQPTTGGGLIFEHFTEAFMHDGEPVEAGVKYLLRTDIMYQRISDEVLKDIGKDPPSEPPGFTPGD